MALKVHLHSDVVTVELAPLTDLNGLVQPGIHATTRPLFASDTKTMVYNTQAGWHNTRVCSGTTGPLLASPLTAPFKAYINTKEPAALSIVVVLVLIITHPGPATPTPAGQTMQHVPTAQPTKKSGPRVSSR